MAKLEKAKVIVDPARRREIISTEAKNLAFAQGYELIEDEGLLGEVGGPRRMAGGADGLVRRELPLDPAGGDPHHHPQQPEMLRGEDARRRRSRRASFSSPTWKPIDGGKAIVAGNERVIRARLSDAKFFYETDLKTQARRPAAEIRADRVPREARHPGRAHRAHREARRPGSRRWSSADAEKAKRAAKLAKADLLTEVVGEFPELQGLMGKYYALAQGEDPSVAAASEDHYKPLGPNDRVPTDPVSIAVALADKIDTLVGFWAIDEKPTGSKDPYALRRAALGVIRIILSNNLRLNLAEMFGTATDGYLDQGKTFVRDHVGKAVGGHGRIVRPEGELRRHDRIGPARLLRRPPEGAVARAGRPPRSRRCGAGAAERERSRDHRRRVEALGKFLDTDDGKNLLAGYKRAANILRIEEKKDGSELYRRSRSRAAERAGGKGAGARHGGDRRRTASAAFAREDFAGAMSAMAKLRPAVDAFFDKVTVNADDKALRENRLILLNRIREATRAVADFSKIEG